MPCDSPFYVTPKGRLSAVPVPCGRCPPCKQRRVNSWVFRLMQEEKRATSAYFVTLTYDTRFVPISANGFMTLRKKDYQDFMKRLRKLAPDFSIKYYAAGEYGSKFNRPHYHAIMFNVPDVNLFAKAWSLDGMQLGTVHVGSVTGDSIAYTMKYIDKPIFGKKHGRDDRDPEFALMSKGLGDNYINSATVAYHKADVTRMYATKLSGHKIALPRYYRERIYNKDERDAQKVYAQSANEQRIQKIRLEYEKVYGRDNAFTFEDYFDSLRMQRYTSFYSQQKSRSDL